MTFQVIVVSSGEDESPFTFEQAHQEYSEWVQQQPKDCAKMIALWPLTPSSRYLDDRRRRCEGGWANAWSK